MKLFSFDTESHLLARGVAEPRPVCMTYCWEGEEPQICLPDQIYDVLAPVFADPGVLFVGVNLPHDFGIVVSHCGIPVDWVFEAYEQGRVSNVQIREVLGAIAYGWTAENWGEKDPRTNKAFSKSMAAMVKAHFRVDISESKKDPAAPRLRYAELDGHPLATWDGIIPGASAYALDDAEWPIKLYRSQEEFPATSEGPIVRADGRLYNEEEQNRAEWALHLMRINGPRTDPQAVERFEKYHKAIMEDANERAAARGWLRWNKRRFADPRTGKKTIPGWSEVKIELQKAVAADLNHKVPYTALTPKGKAAVGKGGSLFVETDAETKLVSTAGDVLRMCTDLDLVAYGEAANSRKMINQYLPILRMGLRGPLTCSFDVLKNTGRTSCFNPNQQNPPQKGGYREGFVARGQ